MRRAHLLGRPSDEGIALPAVIATMAALSLFALVALAVVINAVPGSRETGEEKAAISAAQGGIDEYTARLNARPTYYAINGTGVDLDNRAFTVDATGAAIADGRDKRGITVPGAPSGAARFRYRLLTTPEQTARGGHIRLQVTGTTAKGVSKTLTADFGQGGYLKYLYLTDVEALDPALGVSIFSTTRSGQGPYYTFPTSARQIRSYEPDPALYATSCSRHWYDDPDGPGRARGFSYTSSTATPYIEVTTDPNRKPVKVKRTDRALVEFTCTEISFGGNDIITGPLHTNDAMAISGPVQFKGETTTTWGDPSTPPKSPAPPSADRLWRPTGFTGTPSGNQPGPKGNILLPRSNVKLREQASVADRGCLYTGETSIRFDGTAMYVRSPGTTSTASSRCLNTANRASEQRITPIPSVVYVQDSTTSCDDNAFPYAGQDQGDAAGSATTTYSCQYGTAYVSGTVSTQVTLATARDIVVTGDVKYSTNAEGKDILGLVPNNYVWVYHPVKPNGDEVLPASQRVRRIDAAILALNNSFVVQSWDKGSTASPTLTVNGVIAQKFRGPVGTGSGTGYKKNYVYDERLNFLPPPYFLTPEDAPWTVQRLTDG